jgi:hypothetical protein
MEIQVWDAKPIYYPATCRFNKALLEIIENVGPITAIRGNAFEFNNAKFLHIFAFLNPQHYS